MIGNSKFNWAKEILDKSPNLTVGLLGMGHIGSNLYKVLIELGFSVVSFDRTNLNEIQKYDFDVFFNCSGITGDYRSKPLINIDSNINLTHFLIETLKTNSYVCLSSTRVYKGSSTPYSEESPTAYRSVDFDYVYDGSKLLMECMVMNIGAMEWENCAVLRLSNVFGGFPYYSIGNQTLLKQIVTASVNNSEMTINQHSESSKDFVYLEDAIDGIMRAGLINKGHEIYNIASGFSISNKFLTEKLSVKANFNEMMEKQSSSISIDKANHKLGFKPTFNFEELTLQNMVSYE